jgi:hypothetical protein
MFGSALNKIFSGKNVFLFIVVVFLVHLAYRIVLVSYPHPDAGGVENNVTWFIQQLLDGNQLYTDPENRPYSIAQYSPFYYYLCAGIGKLAGISPDNVFSVFVLSRVVSLFFNLLYAALLTLIAGRIFNCTLRDAVLPGMLSFIFLDITTFSRPDSLYHVFFFLSLYLFWLWIRGAERGKQSSKLLVASSVVAVAGLFAKQSAIVLPALATVWFVYKRQMIPLLRYFLTYAATGMLFLWLVSCESGLRPFYQNTVLGLNNGIGLYWFWSNIIGGFYLQFGLLLVPLLIAVVILAVKRKEERFRFLWVGVSVIFVFSNLTALKWGSSAAYFTEWTGLAFLGAAVFRPAISGALEKVHPHFFPILVAWMLLVKSSRIGYPLTNMTDAGNRVQLWSIYNREKEIAKHMQELLRKEKTPFVFNNLYSPQVWLNNFMFRQSVLPQYEVVIFGTWKQQAYDYSNFKKDLETGGIPYLVMRIKSSPPAFLNLALPKYTVADSLSGYYIYQFKP